MCANLRATGNVQVRNAIISAVLCAEVAYLTPRECFHLAALRASATPSRAKSKAARENGKLGGRPKKLTLALQAGLGAKFPKVLSHLSR